MANRERSRSPKAKPVTRKVVVTETVTAEVVTEEEYPCSSEVAPAVFEASLGTGMELLGMAPGQSLGAGLLGLFHGAALAAFNASTAQNHADALLGACTVQGVNRIYQGPGRLKSRPQPHS